MAAVTPFLAMVLILFIIMRVAKRSATDRSKRLGSATLQ